MGKGENVQEPKSFLENEYLIVVIKKISTLRKSKILKKFLKSNHIILMKSEKSSKTV